MLIHQTLSLGTKTVHLVNEYEQCPQLNSYVLETLKNKNVKISLRSYAMSEAKKKNMFGLFPQDKSESEVAADFTTMLPKLHHHINTSHHQWHTHANTRSSLDSNSIITIEGYQQNLHMIFSEQATSMAYSTNRLTIAVYPICMECLDTKKS